MVVSAVAPGGRRNKSPHLSKQNLSASRAGLLELMQSINFGQIERLVIEDGEPVPQSDIPKKVTRLLIPHASNPGHEILPPFKSVFRTPENPPYGHTAGVDILYPRLDDVPGLVVLEPHEIKAFRNLILFAVEKKISFPQPCDTACGISRPCTGRKQAEHHLAEQLLVAAALPYPPEAFEPRFYPAFHRTVGRT